MKKIILTLLIPIAFSMQITIAQNAPITTAGKVVSYGTSAVVTLTVTDFTAIKVCDLLLTYDSLVATATSVDLGPGVNKTYFITDITVHGEISISWMYFNGQTLPSNSVFVNITFEKVTDGYSAIEFDNSDPNNCLWSSGVEELDDTPYSDYYLAGSVTFASGSTQWTGNVDDDWSNASNWDTGVPDGTNNIAIINDVSPNLFPLANTNAECLGLDIASGASVTVPVNSTLTVNGFFRNDGQFTVKSTSAGDGSFINYTAATGTGSFVVERYLTSEKWHYVSPPVSDALSGTFLDMFMEEWDEPTGVWSWIVPTDYDLNPMQGYAVWTADNLLGSKTVSYDGTLNTGYIGSGVLTSDGPNIAPNNHRGYNFVGNPYPSAIDWDASAGWTKSDIDNAIYIWNPAIGNYGSYVGGISQNDVTNIIPGGQGFFVHVPTDFSTGSLTVNNKARLHNSKPFFKATNIDKKLIKLEIASKLNSYSDQAVVLFNEFATENFDPEFDAYDLLGGFVEAPTLCSVSAENELSINTLPETNEDVTVPLKFSVGLNGVYTIEALEIENLENKYGYLKDLQENTLTDLSSQAVYSFFGDVNDNPDRFELLIMNSPLGTDDFAIADDIRIYSDRNIVYLVSNGNQLSGLLNIYDMSGKVVFSDNLKGLSRFETTLNVEKGFYIVKLLTDDKILSEKVLIFN